MLTFRRYEYLCQIAATGDWMSITDVMAAVRSERIAVHQAIRDLKRGGYVKRRKKGGRVEVAITVAGIQAIYRFTRRVDHLYMLLMSRSKIISSHSY